MSLYGYKLFPAPWSRIYLVLIFWIREKLATFAFRSENEYRIMAKKSKANRVQVILECTEHKDSGLPGTSRYVTTKNRRNTSQRLELKKYNPILRRYTIHKEIK